LIGQAPQSLRSDSPGPNARPRVLFRFREFPIRRRFGGWSRRADCSSLTFSRWRAATLRSCAIHRNAGG
jgi:hypothetical protein